MKWQTPLVLKVFFRDVGSVWKMSSRRDFLWIAWRENLRRTVLHPKWNGLVTLPFSWKSGGQFLKSATWPLKSETWQGFQKCASATKVFIKIKLHSKFFPRFSGLSGLYDRLKISELMRGDTHMMDQKRKAEVMGMMVFELQSLEREGHLLAKRALQLLTYCTITVTLPVFKPRQPGHALAMSGSPNNFAPSPCKVLRTFLFGPDPQSDLGWLTTFPKRHLVSYAVVVFIDICYII